MGAGRAGAEPTHPTPGGFHGTGREPPPRTPPPPRPKPAPEPPAPVGAPGDNDCPAAIAAFSAARFAGLPEREPPLFLAAALRAEAAPPPNPAPGIGPIPGICGIPPRATVFIILAACPPPAPGWCRWVTAIRDPRAFRTRREPLSSLVLRRSAGV